MSRNAKTALSAVAVAALLAAGAAHAELSANAAVTSNYMWRGMTQTDDGPALQGGADYNHESGLYAGVWGSNVEKGLEVDVYGGFANEVNGFGYEVGVLSYNYTDDTFSDNVTELKLGGSWGPASAAYYKGDASGAKYTYMEVGAEFELPESIALTLHYGITDPEESGVKNVSDYSVGVMREFSGFEVSLNYAAFDAEDAAIKDEGKAFVMVSKQFDL